MKTLPTILAILLLLSLPLSYLSSQVNTTVHTCGVNPDLIDGEALLSIMNESVENYNNRSSSVVTCSDIEVVNPYNILHIPMGELMNPGGGTLEDFFNEVITASLDSEYAVPNDFKAIEIDHFNLENIPDDLISSYDSLHAEMSAQAQFFLLNSTTNLFAKYIVYYAKCENDYEEIYWSIPKLPNEKLGIATGNYDPDAWEINAMTVWCSDATSHLDILDNQIAIFLKPLALSDVGSRIEDWLITSPIDEIQALLNIVFTHEVLHVLSLGHDEGIMETSTSPDEVAQYFNDTGEYLSEAHRLTLNQNLFDVGIIQEITPNDIFHEIDILAENNVASQVMLFDQGDPQVTVDLNPLLDFTNCGGNSITNNINWTLNSNTSNAAVSINGNFLEVNPDLAGDGIITVTATFDSDLDGTTMTSETFDFDINVDQTTSTHQLNNISLDIFPNPASSSIFIRANGSINFSANLYDSFGKMVMSQLSESEIQVAHLPVGVYLMEVTDLGSGQRVIEKVVIAK